MRYALFPLNTVLFPGSVLPLQIFEQRYLTLVKDCMKQQDGFVIVLISEGREVGAAAEIFSVGCYVEIIDWESLPNGLLGISVKARHRVRLSGSSVRDDGLMFAEAEALQDGIDTTTYPLPEGCAALSDTLKELLKHPFAARYRDTIDFGSCTDICYRLGELLPLDNRQKQSLLEAESSQQLLDQVSLHINALQT
jgi:Lon protease-like protein